MLDVLVIGGGPAGLSAALAAHKRGGKVLVLEREKRLGGILKQCIHDGFGLHRYGEMLTGPEYAERDIELVLMEQIPYKIKTFVIEIIKHEDYFEVKYTNEQEGIGTELTKTLILATGCRERTSKQIFIGGTRPSGIFTAGTAQYFVNIDGYLPCKECVILGSGDIGLIMARRLTLEGAHVKGVYEVKSEPSGLSRNVKQCLEDFNIPLHLKMTVTEVHGEHRVEGVTVAEVDDHMRPIVGTERRIDCDALILSVGLIPENEVAEKLGVAIEKNTGGPVVNQQLMTSVPGVFSCGNALHVNDLVDYVSESGDIAGKSAMQYIEEHSRSKDFALQWPIAYKKDEILYVVPSHMHLHSKKPDDEESIILYFRPSKRYESCEVLLSFNHQEIIKVKRKRLKPQELERIEIKLKTLQDACLHLSEGLPSTLTLTINQGRGK